MTEEEKYIKEHNLDDIDSFLFKEFSIIGGCCSAQKGFEYRVARQVAEKLWKKEEPVSVDWEQRRYEIAREMLPYAAETSRTILMTGHSLGDDAKGKTLAEVCASSAVSFADALIAELRKAMKAEE